MGSEFLEVARLVLSAVGHPMSIREIMRHALEQKLFSDQLSGKTPDQTLKSKLSQEIRRNGDRSEFVRTAPGRFFLREMLSPNESIYSAERFKKHAGGERVLVFDRAWLEAAGVFQGIKTRGVTSLQNQLLNPKTCSYMSRLDAEVDVEHKQVLTYILVTRNDGALLSFRRGNYTNAEEFLRGCRCVGFGGHVRDTDRGLFTQEGMGVTECAIRELSEEIILPAQDQARLFDGNGLELIGVLNDDSSEVGQRHIAFVYRFTLQRKDEPFEIKRGELSVTRLTWLEPHMSRTPIWEFEYWSQLCLLKYAPTLVDTAPSYFVRNAKALKPPGVICMLGNVGSGKTAAAMVLEKQYGYKIVNSGRVMAEILNIPPIPKTPRDIFQERAQNFITSSDGPAQLAKLLYDKVTQLKCDRVIVDGIRQLSTLRMFQRLMSPRQTGILFIRTTPDVAFGFYQEREGTDKTLKEFFNRASAPVEQGVAEIFGESDAIIYNWTGVTRYRKTIQKLMKDLRINTR